MTDLEKALIGAVLALATALVLGLIKWSASRVTKHVEDQPRVDSKLSVTSDVEILRRIGCPCIIVRIIGISDRATRLVSVVASVVVDKAFVEEFDKGFDAALTEGMSLDLPPPIFWIELVRLGQSNDSVIKLGRDDVAEFLLPVPFGPYEHFICAPSQDVEIAMLTAAGERKVIMRGQEIQEMIRSLVEIQGDRLQGPHIQIRMGIQFSSKGPPPRLDVVGDVNQKAIVFPRPDRG